MLERRLIAVDGVVQGVGFRPYVHRLAAANSLRGFVRNAGGGVLIDVEGDPIGVAEFCRQLPLTPPPLAEIATLRVESATPRDYASFRIATSDAAARDDVTSIPPDAATCAQCLAELFDPANHRHAHPFITCTECGPRFTVVVDTPYDRERTTMAAFQMCPRCQREYEDPLDRRFHAESIACPDCGPTLLAHDGTRNGARRTDAAALDAAISALRIGQIVAMKSLGGYHLACDATDASAVARLRHRKHRPAKPFAVMVRDVQAAMALARLSDGECAELTSPARPILLLERHAHATVSVGVAPLGNTIGVMLPSTPLHHLLLAALDRPLVMTSGNRGGDPVVTDESDAIEALGAIADLFLTHDRDIAARCDDSVVRVVSGEARRIRRARGYTPRTLALPTPVREAVLAVGGHLKNTVCVAHGASAHLSAHVGDLDSAAGRLALQLAIDSTLRLAGAQAGVIAHDLHPDYASTHVATALAAERGIARRVAVQHHHAHVAACVAEFGVRGPVIGVVFDGAGLGTDGAVWGGEFLVVDGANFTRSGHLAYVPLPGGDAAARRPWRAAAAHVARVNGAAQRLADIRPPDVGDDEWNLVQQLIVRPDRSPRTSSVGRLFDAVASMLGVCHVASFEGEAAMRLEALAHERVTRSYPVTLSGGGCWTSDPASIVAEVATDLARGRDRAEIATAFHGAVRDLVVLGCERIREETGLDTVVLSGGVFANVLLAGSARDTLAARRFRVLVPRLVPVNDGGLSLGQAYIAACAVQEDACV